MPKGLQTPLVDDSIESLTSSTAAKRIRKLRSRRAKKPIATISQEHSIVVLEGRDKRVRKACGRCRIMKTKCDRELPCKKCMDGDLVCVAGRGKKTEFKGSAEVLENTQSLLIAAVKKLYAMVRNGERWNLGEPEMNEEDLPIIHSIVEKLGCTLPSPNITCAFPAKSEEFAELNSKLQSLKPDRRNEHDRNISRAFVASPRVKRDRARLSESELRQTLNEQLPLNIPDALFGDKTLNQNELKNEPLHTQSHAFTGAKAAMPLPFYPALQGLPEIESPTFQIPSYCRPCYRETEFFGLDNILGLVGPLEQQDQLSVQQLSNIPESSPEGYIQSLESSLQQPSKSSKISRTAFVSLMCGNELSMPISNWTTYPNISDSSTDFVLGDRMDDVVVEEYKLEGDFDELKSFRVSDDRHFPRTILSSQHSPLPFNQSDQLMY